MSHDDFAEEPVPGLPETPPKGEIVLWQGRPDTLELARQALKLNWIAGYFAVLIIWRVVASASVMSFGPALATAIPFVVAGLVACGLILLIAWFQARNTMYTITTARVAMRIGAALTITVNLPFTRIASADLSVRSNGIGTVAITTAGEVRLAYGILWPHLRPGYFRLPQPALRAIPDAARVAKILADAAETRINQPEIRRANITGALPAE